ncbi:hypothetical protein ACFL6K_01285 [Candidatus Latescibacterota bacterium]
MQKLNKPDGIGQVIIMGTGKTEEIPESEGEHELTMPGTGEKLVYSPHGVSTKRVTINNEE